MSESSIDKYGALRLLGNLYTEALQLISESRFRLNRAQEIIEGLQKSLEVEELKGKVNSDGVRVTDPESGYIIKQ